MPIYEPGLEKLVAENVAAGRLAFTGDLATAVHDAEAVFIAVGTPTRRGDGHADLTYVFAAAEQVARALTGYAVIVTKSTVPVGTSRQIAEIVRADASGPRLRRCVQSGIPARGQRHRRFHAPGSRGDRH